MCIIVEIFLYDTITFYFHFISMYFFTIITIFLLFFFLFFRCCGQAFLSYLMISGVPPIFKWGNNFEHLLLDFNFIFSYLGNSFYKVGEYFCSPTL